MQVSLFNTLTRSKEPFVPLDPARVGLYTCGPTVYNYLHVGNYRTYIFEDILRRTLESAGFAVRHVMNITDVGHLVSDADEGEDKIDLKAAKEGKTAWEIAEFYAKTFIEDSKLLHLLPPNILCKATDHVPEQIELIRRLEAKGFTYGIADGVYFDTARFKDYGKLMGLSHQEGLREGARVEANRAKRHSSDFALWKFSPKDRKRHMEWPSPWGTGFPGWHLECSAMSMKYLGESFDIHCGGVDHIPIHHTNEIAQSEAATGKPFVRFWVHGEFLIMNSAKMAKSSGGFIRLQDLQDKGFDPLDFRYLCLTAHYRKQLDFSWEALEGARSALRRLRERAKALQGAAEGGARAGDAFLQRFKAALADDLNAPEALAAVWEALKPGALSAGAQLCALQEADKVLGLDLFAVAAEPELSPELQALLEERLQARRNKDFAAADSIRRRLAEQGVLVEDTKDGQKWRRK